MSILLVTQIWVTSSGMKFISGFIKICHSVQSYYGRRWRWYYKPGCNQITALILQAVCNNAQQRPARKCSNDCTCGGLGPREVSIQRQRENMVHAARCLSIGKWSNTRICYSGWLKGLWPQTSHEDKHPDYQEVLHVHTGTSVAYPLFTLLNKQLEVCMFYKV